MSDKIYQMVTDRILELLERGVAPWKKPWTTPQGALMRPLNLVSRRPYRGINVFLLLAQDYDSPCWLTYKQAVGLGGHVRKGERATPIIFWRVSETSDLGSDEDHPEEETSRRRVLLRYYSVFNVGQCEGISPPEAESSPIPDFDPIAACEAICAAMPKPPELRHGGSRACYNRLTDRVRLPNPSAFSRREHYYSTRFHELAHATGHPSRLNRFVEEGNSGFFGSPSYAREELTAEMAAAMLCGVAGIAPVKVETLSDVGGEQLLEGSAAYLQSWIQVLKADRRAVVLAAARAQKAADYILNRHPQDEALDEAA